jgi:hypothetical protein
MTDGATLLSATFAQGSSPQVPFALPDDTPRTHRLAAPVWV